MKYDIRKLTLAADTLIPQLKSQRHRAILQNYRKHAMLEVSGRFSEIFTPELCTDNPSYRVAMAGNFLELNGKSEIRDFYGSLLDTESTVMMLEGEKIAVADWGFASEAIYHTFMPGRTAVMRGNEVGDLDAIYIESRWISVVWSYDERCRMIGEHVYLAPKATAIRPCPPDEMLTLEEVRAIFDPLIASAIIELPKTA